MNAHDFVGVGYEKTIVGEVKSGLRIDMVTTIADGGRAGIVPITEFRLCQDHVLINSFRNLELAIKEFDNRA